MEKLLIIIGFSLVGVLLLILCVQALLFRRYLMLLQKKRAIDEKKEAAFSEYEKLKLTAHQGKYVRFFNSIGKRILDRRIVKCREKDFYGKVVIIGKAIENEIAYLKGKIQETKELTLQADEALSKVTYKCEFTPISNLTEESLKQQQSLSERSRLLVAERESIHDAIGELSTDLLKEPKFAAKQASYQAELRKKRNYLMEVKLLLAPFEKISFDTSYVYGDGVVERTGEDISFRYYDEAKALIERITCFSQQASLLEKEISSFTSSIAQFADTHRYVTCQKEVTSEERIADCKVEIIHSKEEKTAVAFLATQTLDLLPKTENAVNLRVLKAYHLVSCKCDGVSIFYRGKINRTFDTIECYEITMEALSEVSKKAKNLTIANCVLSDEQDSTEVCADKKEKEKSEIAVTDEIEAKDTEEKDLTSESANTEG